MVGSFFGSSWSGMGNSWASNGGHKSRLFWSKIVWKNHGDFIPSSDARYDGRTNDLWNDCRSLWNLQKCIHQHWTRKPYRLIFILIGKKASFCQYNFKSVNFRFDLLNSNHFFNETLLHPCLNLTFYDSPICFFWVSPGSIPQTLKEAKPKPKENGPH